MGLSRRGARAEAPIWPGFVDALTSLLLVLMFVLTIFVVVQAVLSETITTQDTELDSLTDQIAGLADALGLERNRATELSAEIGRLGATLSAAQARGQEQADLIVTLTGQLAARQTELTAASAQITTFEAQVAALITARDVALGQVSDLQAEQAQTLSEKEALDLALATARSEVDAQAEAARLAAIRREALESLIASLRTQSITRTADLNAAQTQLSQAEADRLTDAAALAALRERLAGADSELTAMTLALEEQRKRAEDTLTLLAAAQTKAAEAARALGGDPDALLTTAQNALLAEQEKSLAAARQVTLLNEQIAALRGQLGALQGLLDAAAAKDADASVQIEALGSQLNSALAQVASEQRQRAEMEAAERIRLQAENQDLAKFRSEFFGQLSQVLAGRDGVRVVGDRFVFSSEVLFTPGSSDLAPEGLTQIAGVVATLNEVIGQIPPGIDWIIRVDGHTDNVPLSGAGAVADNWELSQARALSVVRYMQDGLGFPPNRLAATGFGEWQPVDTGDTPAALAANRRIELKLTER